MKNRLLCSCQTVIIAYLHITNFKNMIRWSLCKPIIDFPTLFSIFGRCTYCFETSSYLIFWSSLFEGSSLGHNLMHFSTTTSQSSGSRSLMSFLVPLCTWTFCPFLRGSLSSSFALNLFQILYLDSYLNCLRLNWGSKINDVRGSFTSEKLLWRSQIDWSEFYGQSKTLYYGMNNTKLWTGLMFRIISSAQSVMSWYYCHHHTVA